MGLGIRPDILVCRTEHPISDDIRRKLSMFCDIDIDAVIEAQDAGTIYELPLIMEEKGLARTACKKLGIEDMRDMDYVITTRELALWAKECCRQNKKSKRKDKIGSGGKIC